MRDAGVVVDPSVVITHGCVDALQMSLRLLTRPSDLIAAESPTYYGLLQLADLLGLKVIEIPSDPATGMSLEVLQLAANQWSIKALVLTTRLSNPLGGTMPEKMPVPVKSIQQIEREKAKQLVQPIKKKDRQE